MRSQRLFFRPKVGAKIASQFGLHSLGPSSQRLCQVGAARWGRLVVPTGWSCCSPCGPSAPDPALTSGACGLPEAAGREGSPGPAGARPRLPRPASGPQPLWDEPSLQKILQLCSGDHLTLWEAPEWSRVGRVTVPCERGSGADEPRRPGKD